MTEGTFFHAVNRINSFLGGVKDVPMHTKMAWLDKVKHIPDEAVEFIVEKITDEVDARPRNMPKAFREKFSLWLRENPDKAAGAEQSGCSACENGILFLERIRGGKKETASVFCRCYRGTTGKVGRASLHDMQLKGWRSTKADTVGPASPAAREKAHGHMDGAKAAEKEPDPLRYDGYEARYDEEHW
jgi:hypothetical protein